ncbi:condensation domain-containing protein [Pseudoalteromonas aurantia]|uniref:Non-ribosomal peptide synthetase n=1 Tax=Pseudoalteromonas aurantia 208 TaxID=1314867 RepID=A0ABR9EHT3_9GAMM|nr:condensation domain-containing protein [Pseudoalteromonas aurantia]MBE0369964.1 hypothetical protein [Pseudoalteromonas aurantia 208]
MNSPQQIIAHAEACNIVLYLKGSQLAYISEEGEFPESLKSLIRNNKNEISSYLQKQEQEKQQAQDKTRIIPVDKKAVLPLSFAQQGLWFIDQLEGGSSQYNIHAAFGLKGEINLAAVQWALNVLIERHEVLRTVYIEKEGEVRQLVQSLQHMELPLIDLSEYSEMDQRAQVQQWSAKEMNQVFNLQADLMLKAKVLKRTDHDHVLLFTLHHIASDAWSQAIMIGEFITLYDSYCKKLPNTLPPIDIQYCDYAHWQRNHYTDEKIADQLVFWKEMLAGAPYSHSLPFDRPRAQHQKFAGDTYSWFIGNETMNDLKSIAKANQSTLFMLLYSAFSVLIGRWSQTRDVVIGSPIAGRAHPQVAPMIGYFINSMMYRSQWEEGESFSSLLSRNRQNTLSAFDNQDIPFDSLVDKLKIPRELSHSPLFQIMFTLQNTEQSEFKLADLDTYPVMGENSLTKYDLQMVAEEDDAGMWLNLTYSTDLFDIQTIKGLSESFDLVLKQLSKSVDMDIEHIALSPKVKALNKQNLNSGLDSVNELFEQVAHSKQEAIAIQDNDEWISYQQLNGKANRLARYLIAQGLISGQTVDVCLAQNIQCYVVLLAVLKAGGVYAYHELKQYETLSEQYKCLHSGNMLIHANKLAKTCNKTSLIIDESLYVEYDDDDLDFSEVILSEGDPAIESGCGNGTQVSHGTVCAQILRQQKSMALTDESSLLILPTSSNLCVTEWLSGLTAGAKLVLHDNQYALRDVLISKEISHVTLTPSLLAELPCRNDYNLEQVSVVAEHGCQNLVWQWSALYPVNTVLNVDMVTYISAGQVVTGEPINLGHICDNDQTKVLYKNAAPVPQGAVGHLYTSGVSGKGLYDSELQVRQLNNGTLSIIDYKDGSVTRESLELEAAVSSNKAVRQVVVYENIVYASFINNNDDMQGQLSRLEKLVKDASPTYLLPKNCVVVERMPLLSNGKIDKKRLSEQSAFWKKEIKGFPTPEHIMSKSQHVGEGVLTRDLLLDKQVSIALETLACQYNVSMASAFSVIFNMALAIHLESTCVLNTVSGLPIAGSSSGFIFNQFDNSGTVQTNMIETLNKLHHDLENGFVEQTWITQEYNKFHRVTLKNIFDYRLDFNLNNLIKESQGGLTVNKCPVSLLITNINSQLVSGVWSLEGSTFNQTELTKLEKVIELLILGEQSSLTLTMVKAQLDQHARSKLRSAKRKFKPVKNKKQFPIEGNVA